MNLSAVFLHLFNVSVSASILALAVVLFRFVFKKAPKWLSVFLWALVAVRLVCPFSIESTLSLIPSAEVVPQKILTAGADTGNSASFGLIDNPVYSEFFNSNVSVVEIDRVQRDVAFYAIIWLIGTALMLLYAGVSYLKLKHTVRVSVPYKDNVRLCDSIKSPFILGFIRPAIFLPSDMDEVTAELVLRHENAHLKRKDHLWKPLGFVLLSVYWFNPVLWASYILLCRDIELACDERVIKDMESADKKAYSEALLSCSAPQKMISACPVAFGEVGVKKRIKSVLNYKKPAFWIVLIALVASVVLALCFMTDPKGANGGYKTFNGLDEIKEFSFSMNEIMIDCHTYTVIKGDNDYFEAKQDDGFAYSDIKSFLRSLELGVMVDGELNHKQEIQSDVVIRMLCEDDYEFSVVLFDNYQKLYIYKAESNGKYFSRSKDYAVLNPDDVEEYFENESYKRHTVWAFDPSSSAYGFQELRLFVDEKFIISGEVKGEGVIQSIANEENGLKGVSWRPDVTNMQKEYNIIIPVTYEGKSSAFNITLVETGKKNFCTYYNVCAENTVLANYGNNCEFLLSFADDRNNMEWYYNPMLSATGYAQLSFILSNEFDITGVEATSGEAELTDYFYKSELKKAVWSPDYDKLANMYDTEITVHALKGDKAVDFRVRVIPLDGSDEMGGKTFRLEPQNCNAMNYRWATYQLSK